MGSDGDGEVAERNAASDVRVGNEEDSTEGGESGLFNLDRREETLEHGAHQSKLRKRGPILWLLEAVQYEQRWISVFSRRTPADISQTRVEQVLHQTIFLHSKCHSGTLREASYSQVDIGGVGQGECEKVGDFEGRSNGEVVS